MLTFEWNALRTGDLVVMHDAAEAQPALVPGVVAAVSMRSGTNGVGVRIATPDGRGKIVWPNALVVHLSPADDDCWRCQID